MNTPRRRFMRLIVRLTPGMTGCAVASVMATRAHAQQRRSLADPLRLGVDTALADAGLAQALQQAFGRDTGIAVQLVPRPVLPLLEALERGELDAALANAPAAEAALERQGLAHDRRPVAHGEFVLVGPAARGKALDPAGISGFGSAAQALVQIRSAALASPGTVAFVSAADGSGTHVAEQALWRAARIAPVAPWYVEVAGGAAALATARARAAYALVERGAWTAQGGAPLAVLVERDPSLAEAVHVMRSFRVAHPAGKIFAAWVVGPKGRRVIASQRAYRAPEQEK